MVRRKAESEAMSPRPARKRGLPVDPYDVPDETESPKRRRRLGPSNPVNGGQSQEQGEDEDDKPPSGADQTPSKRRDLPAKSAPATTTNGQATTPSALRHRSLVETPVKTNGVDTPSRRNIADRSARRKSARALIDRVISDAISDDEVDGGDIAREIYESSEDEDDEEAREDGQAVPDEEDQEPTTPSRAQGRKRRVQARKRSPTAPRDLPPHEQYFYQNKPGLTKTSNNTLSSLTLLTHEEYFSVLRQLREPHESDVDFLRSLHAQSFPQWAFELSQGFTPCLYGYGSKRRLLYDFATYLSSKNPASKIVVINGYVRTLTVRDILSTLSAALPTPATASSSSSSKPPMSTSSTLPTTSGGTNPTTTLQAFLSHLSNTTTTTSTSSSSSNSAPAPTITVLINSIDAPPLRKPSTQALLSQLAACRPRVRLACTADTPDFALLWDAPQRAAFGFAFHDCTTFAGFGASELEVVDEVHELLGRRARRAGGKEGVVFVLRSLPENARSLFRLLVGEVLVAAMEAGGDADDDEGGLAAAVEYRMVYNKAVEEFICSSEMAFRTLLKE